MRAGKRLALDANILLRGVFGVRVRELLDRYADEVRFYSPDICFDDARRYIPLLAARRGFAASAGLEVLDGIARFVELVDRDLYEEHEGLARASIASRGHRGLAGGRDRSAAPVSGVDGRQGLLRKRGRNLDHGHSGGLSAGRVTEPR